jgi:hypothetical protein
MKTITIKQPWGFLICSGIKDIENRTWPTKFRGRVLVHASAKPVKGLPCEILSDLHYANVFASKKLETLTGPNGAIIGSVDIVDCVQNHESIWAESTLLMGDFQIYNWVLANPVLFAKPILNVKGKLSFWDYPMTEKEYMNIETISNPLKY